MNPADLELLMCPKTKGALRVATDAEVAAANARIESEGLAADPLEAGLCTGSGDWIYPVRDGIPVLLATEAIGLSVAGANESTNE